ncbi:transposase family protein [Streptomyces mirabilis]|uniref:transposase family protein n=1 Tax=Streptomyces mirabilis TaxID=68239 RepID=UPI0037F9956C
MPCPKCGTPTTRAHGFHERTVADLPVNGRRAVVSVRVRHLVCPRQAFRKQVPGLLDRYQRRTTRITGQLGHVVKELAGRASARLSRCLFVAISRSTALRILRPYVPNIASTLVTALMQRHQTAPDRAASRAKKKLLALALADHEDGRLCCCDCRTSPCPPTSASYGCCR